MPVFTAQTTLDLTDLNRDVFADLLDDGTVVSFTATEIILDTFNEDGDAIRVIFVGTGFGAPNADGFPTTGALTGFSILDADDNTILEVTGLNISAADLLASLTNPDRSVFANLLFGGNDTITGGNEPGVGDILEGLGGDDIIRGRDGADLIRGGAGADTLYGGNETGPSINFERDTLDGGEGNDLIYGEGGNDTLLGGVGADVIEGGDGNDTLYDAGDGVTDRLTFLSIAGPPPFAGEVRQPFINDARRTDDDVDTLRGGAGNDGFVVGIGDVVDGGDGVDAVTVVFNRRSSGVTLDLSGDQAAALAAASGGSYTGVETFSVHGSNFGDTIIGSSGADSYEGGLGADRLEGRDGNDSLIGSTFSHFVLLPDGRSGARVDDGAADTLIGGLGNDSFTAGAGDQVDGGDGTDSLQLTLVSLGAGVSIDLTQGDRWAALAAASGGSYVGMESLGVITLTEFDDVLRISGVGNSYGLGGNDQIFGDAAVNFVGGNEGNDLIETFGGNDRVWGGAGDDRILAGDGNDIVDADLDNNNNLAPVAFGNDYLDGGAGNDTLNGGGGDDIIIGGLGADQGDGGDGYDIADYSGATAGISVIHQLVNPGNGQLVSAVRGTGGEALNDVFRNMEQVTGSAFSDIMDMSGSGVITLLGGAGDDQLTVSVGLANILDGGDGNDTLTGSGTLRGGAGDDTITTGFTNDLIDGGSGVDTVTFGLARSNYTITNVNGEVRITGPGIGTDVLAGIERLRFSDGLYDITGALILNEIVGTDGSDTLTGTNAGDRFDARGGDDFVTAGLGDSADGGAGNDRLVADFSARNDLLALDLSQDAQTAIGSALNGTITNFELFSVNGTRFNDSITGTAGANTIYGGLGQDTIRGGGGNDQLWHGDSIVVGLAHDDLAVDLLEGGDGADVLYIGQGDSANGGAGVDRAFITFHSRQTGLNLDLTNTIETTLETAAGVTLVDIEEFAVFGTLYNDVIVSDAGSQRIFAGEGDNVVRTGAGDDYLSGGQGNDQLEGGSGADVFYYVGGADVMLGGDDNDLFLYGSSLLSEPINAGNATFNGGAGVDTLDFSRLTTALTVNLGQTTSQNIGFGTVIINNVENVNGGQGADRITGTAETNILNGGGGSDLLAGGLGDDTLSGGDGADILVAGIDSVTNSGIDILDGGADVDQAVFVYAQSTGSVVLDNSNGSAVNAITVGGIFAGSVTNVENLLVYGGSGNDTMTGSAGFDQFVGGAGADTLNGGEGDDSLAGGAGDDILNGGGGRDSANYFAATAGVTVDLRLQGAAQNTLGDGADTLVGFESLTGSDFNDVLTGSAESNTLSGGNGSDRLVALEGADTIFGGSGDDIATGGAGNDTIDGGVGNDTAVFSGSIADYAITSVAGGGVSVVGADGSDVIRNVERIRFDDGVFVLATGRQFLEGGDTADTLVGSFRSDEIFGLGGDDTLSGGDGDDLVVGGLGNDTIDGGAGQDTAVFSGLIADYAITSVAGGVSVVGADGSDVISNVERVRFDDGIFVLATGRQYLEGGNGAETIVGSFRADEIYGLGGNDTLNGGGGDDLIIGGLGNDLVDGGAGQDTAVFAGSISNYTITSVGGGISVVGADGSDLITNVERVRFDDGIFILATGRQYLEGGNAAETIVGSFRSDEIDGLGGDDTLNGGLGDDVIIGGQGNDVIDGGAGVDTAIFSGSITSYNITSVAGGVSVVGPDGSDVISNIERVRFDDGIFILASGYQYLEGSNAAESIIGSFRSDEIHALGGNDTVNGGTGDDTIIGGTGDDLIDGGAGTDLAVFAGLRSSYTITQVGGETRVVGADGDDRLMNVEQLQFSDGVYDISGGPLGGSAADAPPFEILLPLAETGPKAETGPQVLPGFPDDFLELKFDLDAVDPQILPGMFDDLGGLGDAVNPAGGGGFGTSFDGSTGEDASGGVGFDRFDLELRRVLDEHGQRLDRVRETSVDLCWN